MTGPDRPKPKIVTRTVLVEGGAINVSSPSFHEYAKHYFECVQLFRAAHPKFSPLPYALLCRAIELELKARHLADAHLPAGNKQKDVAQKYRHDLQRLYNDLPTEQKILDAEEHLTLNSASDGYNQEKGYDYISPYDMGSGFSRFPNLDRLNDIARKLLECSPVA